MTSGLSSFVTLTYDDEHVKPSLDYGDFQKFMRALRYARGPTRFFAVGEYGDLTKRPHFHAILFGQYFQDSTPCGKEILFSKELQDLWPNGFANFGQVTYQSASYVAGYCLKKVVGKSEAADRLRGKKYSVVDEKTGEIVEIKPEMAHMSLKPGIGWTWFEKYWKEVYLGRDGCVLKGGQKVPAPKYYDKLLEKIDEDLRDEKSFERYLKSLEFREDCSRERLEVREKVAFARLAQRERIL